ncbi:hypothetical protein JX266_010192 [Neoarthrinium moseri]|nr:hypothetical protein JX266_010192 [Neoarthrinium moseri]
MTTTRSKRPLRPIRIGNASGAIGDGIDQIYKLAKSGSVDAITADYLAEFNIAWKAIELQTQPELGYEPNFLEQLAWENGDAARLVAEKRIKIVHDGGALNPKGLAVKVDEYFKNLGFDDVKVAAVIGDDVTKRLRQNQLGSIRHLDRDGEYFNPKKQKILAANAYTGQSGIVSALQAGADIVICGRCCDASPVMGLAYWWHGWNSTEYDKMAGSLMAGHLIECGAYVTGGNFCGAQEIEHLHHAGYPIAEISCDGTAVITKPVDSNGAVTVDTCKAQLLYEIQGPIYLNADVVADIEQAKLEEVGKDRVRVTGIKGMAPPLTAKLAICLAGGWQAELSGFCAGLDTDFKFQLLKDQVMRQINPNDFSTISIEKYGTPSPNPRSQAESTVHIRMFAQSPDKDAMIQFKRAIFYNGMQGYCGLHLSMDWRTMEARPYVKYFPALMAQSDLPLEVQFIGTWPRVVAVEARRRSECILQVPVQRSHQPAAGLHEQCQTIRRPLGDLVFARSGDKGGNANVGFWVRNSAAWPWLQAFMTSSRLAELFADDWDEKYTVERCEFALLHAVHFVVKGILQDGTPISTLQSQAEVTQIVQLKSINNSQMANASPIRNSTGRYENVDFRKAIGFQYPPVKCSYNRRDVLLFANAIGVQRDELHFLYELHPKFAAFPTFPINLGFKQTDQDVFDFIARTTTVDVPGIPPFDPQRSVDGERGIEIVRPLPVSSEGLDLEIRNKVIGAYDKGGAMILESEGELVDIKTGITYARLSSTAFGIGQGGYDGPRGPSKPAINMPTRAPDAIHKMQTTTEIALLYRLCGDYNPLHADEEFGKRAGFKGSILQGLGTWNIAAHSVLRELGRSNPARLQKFGARFKSVVYPGDKLVTRMWVISSHSDFENVVFETAVEEDGRIALSNGYAHLKREKNKL